jgi:transposase-like protein
MNITCHKCGKTFSVKTSTSEIHVKALTKSTRTYICPFCGASNSVVTYS